MGYKLLRVIGTVLLCGAGCKVQHDKPSWKFAIETREDISTFVGEEAGGMGQRTAHHCF